MSADLGPGVRVLVSFEDHYRSYGEAIAGAIRLLRLDTRVLVAGSSTLGAEVARLKPHLVICDRQDLMDAGSTLAWVELPHDPVRPATVRLEEGHPETVDPTLDGLLSIFDEVGRLMRTCSRRAEP